MINIKKINKKFINGIPFSVFKNRIKKTKKKSRSPSRKRRKTRRTIRKPLKVPPKGVIIRKKDKLYRSNGKKLILL